MGYTTKFKGGLALSRKLTIKEAKSWLDMALPHKPPVEKLSYLQWVPSTSLDFLVWDGEEKFYNYVELLKFIVDWLGKIGVTVHGEMVWSGEEAGDTGRITVKNSHVEVRKFDRSSDVVLVPLDERRLAEMALEQVVEDK